MCQNFACVQKMSNFLCRVPYNSARPACSALNANNQPTRRKRHIAVHVHRPSEHRFAQLSCHGWPGDDDLWWRRSRAHCALLQPHVNCRTRPLHLLLSETNRFTTSEQRAKDATPKPQVMALRSRARCKPHLWRPRCSPAWVRFLASLSPHPVRDPAWRKKTRGFSESSTGTVLVVCLLTVGPLHDSIAGWTKGF